MSLAVVLLGAHHGSNLSALNLFARTRDRGVLTAVLGSAAIAISLVAGWLPYGYLRQAWVAGGRRRLHVAVICVGFALFLTGVQSRYLAPILVGAAMAVAGNVAEILWKRSTAPERSNNSAS